MNNLVVNYVSHSIDVTKRRLDRASSAIISHVRIMSCLIIILFILENRGHEISMLLD